MFVEIRKYHTILCSVLEEPRPRNRFFVLFWHTSVLVRKLEFHEFQRDGITICTTFTPFKPENTRLLARKNDLIIDIRVMYDHSKGKTLILSKNISLLVTIKGV